MATPIPAPTPTPTPTVDLTAIPTPAPTINVEIVQPIEIVQQVDPSGLIVNIAIAVVTLAAAAAAWIAVWQSSRYKDRANISGTIDGGGYGGDTPRVEVWFRNHGPIAAEEVMLERRAPGKRDWVKLWGAPIPSPMPPHTSFQFWASVASTSDAIATNGPFPWTGTEPIEGRWQWRITWAGVPNPKRRSSHTVTRRVSKRQMPNLLTNG